MPALRAIVERLGHTGVETYLQSGNVVFAPRRKAPRDLAAQLEAAIADATGHDVPVVMRTAAELRKVVSACPYPVDDPTRVVVGFLRDAIDLGDLTIHDRELFISVPNGQARSKLMEALTKRDTPTTITVRNWRTVRALAELSSA